MAGTQAEIDALLAEAESLAATPGPTAPPQAAAPITEQAMGVPIAGTTGASGVEAGNGRLGRILQIKVPLMVVLAQRKMPVREILNICIGSIIEFEKPFDEELELLVNNRSIAFGHAVKIGENFGLRVTRIGDMKTRIDALGPNPE